jgi:hypothetical protein
MRSRRTLGQDAALDDGARLVLDEVQTCLGRMRLHGCRPLLQRRLWAGREGKGATTVSQASLSY